MIPAAGAGVLTVMVPVVAAHVVGCVGVAVGAAGADGAALMVTVVAAEIQPAAFFTVTLYVPGAHLLNTPVVFV